jgi:hypothetical protein
MVKHRTFGRRYESPRLPHPAKNSIRAATGAIAEEIARLPIRWPSSPPTDKTPLLDDELQQWKKARAQNFKIPWRQMYLMASLCFGIASFVLPDSVNSDVQWLLYALMAASLYAGFAKSREAKDKQANNSQ